MINLLFPVKSVSISIKLYHNIKEEAFIVHIILIMNDHKQKMYCYTKRYDNMLIKNKE